MRQFASPHFQMMSQVVRALSVSLILFSTRVRPFVDIRVSQSSRVESRGNQLIYLYPLLLALSSIFMSLFLFYDIMIRYED